MQCIMQHAVYVYVYAILQQYRLSMFICMFLRKDTVYCKA